MRDNVVKSAKERGESNADYIISRMKGSGLTTGRSQLSGACFTLASFANEASYIYLRRLYMR